MARTKVSFTVKLRVFVECCTDLLLGESSLIAVWRVIGGPSIELSDLDLTAFILFHIVFEKCNC